MTLATVSYIFSASANPGDERSRRANGGVTKMSETADGNFRWHGRVASGQAIEIKGLHGNVRAEPASGEEVEVVTNKHRRGSAPDSVRIEVLEHENGVTICAIYPTLDANHPYVCRPGEDGGGNEGDKPSQSFGLMNFRNKDVQVDFSVRVPSNVRFIGRTIKGDIEAVSLKSNVEATTANGSVHVSTAGYARARTVNGSITATFGAADWPEALEFRTINGDIDVELPANANTSIYAETLHGDITTDVPVNLQREGFGQTVATGTLGSGGRQFKLTTFRGHIKLHRSL
jgi:hypothetical protein